MKVVVTGHRPQSLGGFGQTRKFKEIKKEISKRLLEYKPDLLITGMALGMDQWSAECCIELKIPFTAALPCKGQERVWPSKSQEHYRWLLSKASDIIYVDRIRLYQDEKIPPDVYSGSKMLTRNRWMVDQMVEGDLLLSLWNPYCRKGGTWHCVDYFKAKWRSDSFSDCSHFNINPSNFDDVPF